MISVQIAAEWKLLHMLSCVLRFTLFYDLRRIYSLSTCPLCIAFQNGELGYGLKKVSSDIP